MKKANLTSLINKIIGPIFYILLIIFVLIYIQKLDWSVLNQIKIQWQYVVIATILSLLFIYWGAFIWMQILITLGAKNIYQNFIPLLHVYAKSWLGRYIPGTAPWILGKIYFAAKLGVSKNKLAVSSLLEGALQIAVTFSSSLLILLIDVRTRQFLNPEMLLVLAFMLLGSIIVMIPTVFNKIFATAYRLLKRKKFNLEHAATNQSILRGSSMYLLGSFVNGIAFFFIAKAVFPDLGYQDLFYVVGISNLASAISMVAIFAPSGIGVREGIQIAMLSAIMPVEIATIIALVTRIWNVACDLLFYGLNQIIFSLTQSSKK